MDDCHFDRVARSLAAESGTRRAALRVLAGGALSLLATRFGASEALGGKKGKGKGKGKKPKRCPDLKPLCELCQETRCNTATGQWDCHDLCQGEETCCNGHCEPPCMNGCDLEPEQNCLCAKTRRDEDVYCAESYRCGENPCEPGQEYDSVTCTCQEPCGGGSCPLTKSPNPDTCACECPNGGIDCGNINGALAWCCPPSHSTCWWEGGLRIGCLEESGGHVCPNGWTYMPNSDPAHRYCWPPPGPSSLDGKAAAAEGRHAATATREHRREKDGTRGGRSRGRERGGRKRRRGASKSVTAS